MDHVARQVGLGIEGFQQVAQLHGPCLRAAVAIRIVRAVAHDAAGHHAAAERDAHPTADRWDLHAVRHPVAQRRQPRYRDGDGHDHRHQSPRRMDRTRFMSSQTSRLRSGLRSRKAGWNVGTSFAPRHA